MNELMGYSNVDNPYGDNNLTDKFKWHKKREMEEKKGISEDEARERDIARRRETVAELEKLKKRRVERELEQAQHEQELVRLEYVHTRALVHVCRRMLTPLSFTLLVPRSNGCNASGSAKCTATWSPRKTR